MPLVELQPEAMSSMQAWSSFMERVRGWPLEKLEARAKEIVEAQIKTFSPPGRATKGELDAARKEG